MAGCKVSARIINAHAKVWFLHPCALMRHWMTNILQTQQKETRLITPYMMLTFKIFVTVQESPVRWHVSIIKGNNALNLHPCHSVKSVSLSLEWALCPGQGSCLLACFDHERAAIWESSEQPKHQPVIGGSREEAANGERNPWSRAALWKLSLLSFLVANSDFSLENIYQNI